MTQIDPEFADELARFGVDTTMDCFNCGTCAAICPLLYEHFPRKMIRYAQIGAVDRILENYEDLWRCLHCGLCIQTCPREAYPGDLILGMRRMVIDHWRRA